MLLTSALAAASMMALAQTQPNPCEETFRKGGNPVTGLRFVAERSVADLSPASAVGQLRGIVITKGYIVMAAEPEAGTMLIEQPATGKARGFSIEISVSEAEGHGTVRMEARLRAAMAVKDAVARAEMCGILSQLQGGKAGIALAKKGNSAEAASTAPLRMSVLRFSSQIGGEARKSSVSIEPRYTGRVFTLYGPLASVSRAGEGYRIDFKLVDNMLASLAPGTGYRAEVSCRLAPGQSTYAQTLKPNSHVELTGTFDSYDESQSRVWLRDCAPTK